MSQINAISSGMSRPAGQDFPDLASTETPGTLVSYAAPGGGVDVSFLGNGAIPHEQVVERAITFHKEFEKYLGSRQFAGLVTEKMGFAPTAAVPKDKQFDVESASLKQAAQFVIESGLFDKLQGGAMTGVGAKQNAVTGSGVFSRANTIPLGGEPEPVMADPDKVKLA